MRRRPHPADYRGRLLLAALVAVGVWWGLGLPYSVTAWLLDAKQLRWTLFCYAWEVPVAGFLGPLLVPQIWWRNVTRRWNRVFAVPEAPDLAEAAVLEGKILDYPIRVGRVLLITSLVGYAVGAIQLYVFSQMPFEQLVHVVVLGMVTGLVGALFAFLYLERLLTPLLFELGRLRPTAPPAGRRVPLRTKIFACSLVLMVSAVPLFVTVFWNQSARVLEVEAGKRLLGVVQDAAGVPERPGIAAGESARQALAGRADLGTTGRAYVVDRDGVVLAKTGPALPRLDDEAFRPAVLRRIMTEEGGHLVDRTGLTRLIAFARTPNDGRRVVVVVPRAEFDHELRGGLQTAGVIFLTTLGLALGSSYLFARRLGRPIEVVTAVANRTAREPAEAWEPAPVRTNDEVGELAVALNLMTLRLREARDALARSNAELEERVREATRNTQSLYDTTKAITSTLELGDVLRLIEERLVAALGLRDLVLLRHSPVDGSIDAYATACGHIELGPGRDLSNLCGTIERPTVRPLAAIVEMVPPPVRVVLAGPDVLCLPLVFKDVLSGVVLASLDPARGSPDLELADAIARQTSIALANVGLFETVQRHEIDLRELSERLVLMREDTLRAVSRELHDGVGQALAAIKVGLASIEQSDDDVDGGTLRERVHELQTDVTELIQEVRRMSQLLRPSMLDDLGLIPSLRMLVESVSARAGIPIRLRTPTVEQRLPPAIEVLLFRVTQEALTNMVKHAQARSAWVDLVENGTHATLTISDDGVGFDVEAFRRRSRPSGVGLLGMRERVAYHRGSIEVRSRPCEGVRITLTIPIGAGAARN